MVRMWSIAMLLTGAQAPAAARPPGSIAAFIDVSVIPMDRERVLADQTVLVRGDRRDRTGRDRDDPGERPTHWMDGGNF
jgi:hypothetical protein